MNGEIPGATPGLAGYWPMNEGSGNTLHDVSGNGRDVQLNGSYGAGNWVAGAYSLELTSNYRYAFNGKELDGDLGSDDYDYGMRIHDARLGKFLSVDPLTKDYPWNSTYAFAENSPIENLDLDGEEIFNYKLKAASENGTTVFKVESSNVDDGFAVEMGLLNFFGQSYIHRFTYNGNSVDLNRIAEFKNLTPDNFKATSDYQQAQKLKGIFIAAVLHAASNAGETYVNRKIAAADEAVSKPIVEENAPVAFTTKNSQNGVTLTVNGKAKWSSAQNQEAQEKADGLSGTVYTKNPVPRESKLRQKFIKAGGQVGSDQDVDHIVDLQLKGTNAFTNLKGLNSSVNRSFGPQLQSQLKNLPDNTKVNKVLFIPHPSSGKSTTPPTTAPPTAN